MRPTHLAEILAPHVELGWEHVAEVARPGTAAKVAAVRAGASTVTLPATDAVRALAEAPDPRAAVAGETRSTVLAAADGARHRAPTALLFDGTPAEVAENLEGRASITDAMVAAYLDADEELRAAAAYTMVTRAEPRGVVAVLCERAGTLRPAVFTNWVLGVLADLAKRRGPGVSSPLARRTLEQKHAARQMERIDGAAVAALRAWLAHHGGAGHTVHLPWPGLRIPTVELTPPESAGAGLAVFAAVRGSRVVGPPSLGRAVLAVYGAAEVVLRHEEVARVAAGTGVPWAEVRAALFGDAPLGDDGSPFSFGDLVRVAVAAAEGTDPADARWCSWVAEMLAAELSAPVSCTRGDWGELHELLLGVAPQLGGVASLRAAALSGETRYPWGRAAYGETFRGLVQGGHLDPDEVDEVLAVDPVVAEYVNGAIRTVLAGDSRISPQMWRFVARYAHSCDLAQASARNPEVAARWAALLTGEVEGHVEAGVDRGELWAATLALAPTLAQTSTDAVAVAAATIGD